MNWRSLWTVRVFKIWLIQKILDLQFYQRRIPVGELYIDNKNDEYKIYDATNYFLALVCLPRLIRLVFAKIDLYDIVEDPTRLRIDPEVKIIGIDLACKQNPGKFFTFSDAFNDSDFEHPNSMILLMDFLFDSQLEGVDRFTIQMSHVCIKNFDMFGEKFVEASRNNCKKLDFSDFIQLKTLEMR